MYTFDIITLFPESVEPYATSSILGRAQEDGKIAIEFLNFREYGLGKHNQVDDTPFGGGAGMVLKPEPIFEAVEATKKKRKGMKTRVLLMTPQGKTFNHQMAVDYARDYDNLIMIAGRYEGFDERIRQHLVDEEVSVGDYVLTGGELPAMIITDAVARQIPGVLGAEASLEEESFADTEQTLEYPHYTKPAEYNGMNVPDVLLSGDHKKIAEWRKANRRKKS